MRILVTGAQGMLGKRLTAQLLTDGQLHAQPINKLILSDVVATPPPAQTDIPLESTLADLSQPGVAQSLLSAHPDVIYHLAAVVSGEAERDMQKGYRINLDSMRELLQAIHVEHERNAYTPTVIFASSIAVFGAPFSGPIEDDFHLTPLTSYGVQKAMCELLLSDYHRRGIIRGIGLRLPTICIRPGKPNAAASGFFSGILREPLNGQKSNLPVADTVRHWFASPRAAVGFLIHAAGLDQQQPGARCCMTLPGLSATVAEQIESLRELAGNDAVALIERKPDPSIAAIVAGWPEAFNPARATALGFKAETSFNEIIDVYMQDEMQQSPA